MNIRYVFIIVMLTLLSGWLIGCSANEDTMHNEETIPAIETTMPLEIDADGYLQMVEFEVDNDTPLEELLTEEYALSELFDFFGENICEGDRILNPFITLSIPTWDETNSRFPVHCLRCHENVHYSVYRTTSSGYFYVFWNVPPENSYNTSSSDGKLEITARSTAYIDRLPTASSFETICAGKSTAKDVCEIDPCMQLDLLTGFSTPSYSLLEDGQVMVVYYTYEKLECLDDLTVAKCELTTRENVHSVITAIDIGDMPNKG